MTNNEKTPNTAARLVSLQDAADYWAVSTRTMRRYISKGVIRGYRLGPRTIRVDLNELDRYIKSIPTGE